MKLIDYPPKPPRLGHSPCHWFDLPLAFALAGEVRALPPDCVYLELGSFLGAGSTMAALLAREDLQLICVDHWQGTSRTIQHEPIGAWLLKRRDGKKVPCDFWKGRGNRLQHFLNNTYPWRQRITPVQARIDVELLQKLSEQLPAPQLVLIDDEHQYQPVLDRLEFIHQRWPQATVLLDDCTPYFQGVQDAVWGAFERGWYASEHSRLYHKRLMRLSPGGL